MNQSALLADRFIKCDQEALSTTPSSDEYATLTLPDGKSVQMPILRGTQGPPVIDIRGLYAQTGYFTHDPGFMSTSSCVSSITFIDGPKGLLQYRGYDIVELAEKCDFMDTTYLLLYGDLPDENAKKLHIYLIKRHTMVHEKLIQFYQGFKSDAHPMAICVGVVGALSAFYHDYLDVHNPLNRFSAAYRLLAKMPTIAAMAYKYSIGQPFVYPKTNLSYSENLLNMMFSVPSEPYELNPVLTHALEIWLILHADHEQNASTSTVRIAGSSYANPFACIASGITTLWGSAHGGANQAVLEMLEEIATADRIQMFVEKAKDKSDPFRLMGFGHRVYQHYDPRARIMQEICHAVLDELKIDSDPILELASKLEKVALEDEYFIKRKLFPNVDFYSGVMLRAMGIPKSMFTVLFAVARTIGWFVNWKEMIADPNCKIGRPRQLYIGKQQREILPIAKRKTTLVSCDFQDFYNVSKIHSFKK